MLARSRRLPRVFVLVPVLAAALIAASAASAHARISPPVSLAGYLQLYSLAVPTEKEGVKTTKVVLTVPAGFSIDSFADAPGWHREVQATGAGEDAVIQKVTWTGGSTPTGEDSLFQFLGEASKHGSYTFEVDQTYSDGSIVNWNESESSENPAPTITAKSSFGGGTPLTVWIAIAFGVGGLIVGGIALFSGGGSGKRELA